MRIVSVRLELIVECTGVLPTTQFAYQKGLGACGALLCLSHTLQNALVSGQEARMMQIDFSTAFDRVNLFKDLLSCETPSQKKNIQQKTLQQKV